VSKYYVYEHWRPDTNSCFYIGKGTGKRAYDFKNNRNSHYINIVNKLFASGFSVDVKLHSGLDENEAHALEMGLIRHYKDLGVKLANQTLGGEGISGYRHTEKSKEANRLAHSRSNLSAETLAKMSANRLGTKASTETRQLLSTLRKGIPRPEGVMEKVRQAHIGAKRSDETRKKISEKAKERIISEETKAKMRQAHAARDKTRSPEFIARQRQLTTKQWADPEIKEKMRKALRVGQQRRYAIKRLEEMVCLPVL